MKKRRLKTKLLALSVVLILAALSVYGTLAYFTAQGTARNVITAGDVKIALEERMLTPDGEKTVPFEDQLGVMPGTDVSKIVTVTNAAASPPGCVSPWTRPLSWPRAWRGRWTFPWSPAT